MRAALAPVLADVHSTGAPEPRVNGLSVDDPGCCGVMLWGADGSGSGVIISRADPPGQRTVAATEQVQDWVIEELWRGGSNWPPCPQHPASHPMRPVADEGGEAWWSCPAEGELVARVGSLTG